MGLIKKIIVSYTILSFLAKYSSLNEFKKLFFSTINNKVNTFYDYLSNLKCEVNEKGSLLLDSDINRDENTGEIIVNYTGNILDSKGN